MIEYWPYGIAGLYLGRSTPAVDGRGSFARTFDAAALRAAGGPALSWVEVNHSRSRRATLRGLHFRRDLRQCKQIAVLRGAVFDVVVDLRPWSATYHEVITVELDETRIEQVIIPPGCAHGFQAVSAEALISFASTVPTDTSLDGGFRFDDAAAGVSWPLSPPIVGDRDAALPGLDAVAHELATAFA